jgi:hypothetical protein
MLPPGPLFHKPRSIIAAINILYATLFLGAINSMISQFSNPQTGEKRAEGIVILIITIVVVFILIKQIGAGRKWARTVLLVLFLLGLAGYLWVGLEMFRINLLVAVIALLETILQITALLYLFSKESTAWFHHVGSFKQSEPVQVSEK